MFKKLWSLDFTKIKFPKFTIIWIPIAGFVTYEALNQDLIVNYFELFNRYLAIHPSFASFQYVMYLLAVLMAIFVFAMAYFTEKKGTEVLGHDKLYSIVIPHFLVNIIDIAIVAAIISLVQFIIEYTTGEKIKFLSLLTVNGEFHPLQGVINFYNLHFPTYVKLPYILAILATIILTDLPIYITHYMVHWFRFLWLVVHRSHHSPEYLHPFGSGPVFSFSFLILVPFFFVKLAVSKLFYTEPLIVELLVIQVIFFVTEKFNHSSAFYEVAFKNKFIYGIFTFLGNGPYHMTHHSAKEGDEIVNLANLGFNFWDRLFGTFQKPDKVCPPLGLTHQPKIKLNPFRLYFGGICTILYELKHNELKHWFKILFGSVYYTPPVTKDFLIESYPNGKTLFSDRKLK
ncbi:MAG TPA: sterol desaturase family protein [Chitinophagales bacterium]|nr:sterol desaturase family protein [Chitinophagales bacterium]